MAKLDSLRAGSPLTETRACNNHDGSNSITRGLQRPRVSIGGDCQINKMLNKLKSMQKSNKFKASLSSFEGIWGFEAKYYPWPVAINRFRSLNRNIGPLSLIFMRQLWRNVCLLRKHCSDIVRICEEKCFSSFEAKYWSVDENIVWQLWPLKQNIIQPFAVLYCHSFTK